MNKSEEESFVYCPICGAKELLQNKIDGLKCASCGFDFFLNPKPACVAVIFDKQGKLLMTQRAMNPLKGYWDLPSGFVKKGEDAEEALKRELKEELDIEVSIKDYFWSVIGDYPYKGLTYMPLDFCFICSFKGSPSPKDDVSAFRYFSIKELPKKIAPHHKKIVDKLIETGKLI